MQRTEEIKDSNNKVGLLIMLNPKLKENFKIKAIKEQTTMADIVVDAIKKYVEG